MRARVLTAGSLILLTAVAALAQFGGPRGPFHEYPNIPYDGQFTFVRLKYTHGPGGNWYGGWPAWAHGYPLAEQNLMRIMQEVSYINPHVDEINALTLDDPGAVPLSARLHHRSRLVGDDRSRGGGAAHLSAEGRLRHRRRLQAAARRFGGRFGGGLGGDLGGGYGTGWEVFEAAMKRVLPRGPVRRSRRLASDLPLVLRGRSPRHHPAGLHRRAGRSSAGCSRTTIRRKRLQMIVNYNTDVSQFWEWSGTGLRPIDETNEAYKLGVNYIIYGSDALDAE